MEVVCVNSNFPPEWLEIYKKNGVRIPILNTIYTLRELITHTTGEKGVLLNEIINPPIEINHPILGKTFREVTWNVKRFTTLLGEPISLEEFEIIEENETN